jgi:4-phospho-D-threonate 3-dehydrogenase / 4-phospho-D-erythronate 3-dehydrogenase
VIDRPDQAMSSPGVIPCLPSGDASAESTPPAVIDARGGEAAYAALTSAARLALDGEVDAIVTAPLHKAALHAAGHYYPGHTELLAELCGVKESAMMLYLAQGGAIRGEHGLGVVHVTLHMALRDVFAQLSSESIAAKALLADAVMRAMGAGEGANGDVRIGIAALNPHAGEQGLFGDEEISVISPAVERSRKLGLAVDGPLPCDTLMVRAAAGQFDAVVAMYHDQGHIALKLLGMHRAVNITLGLPIIRTSVAHGTAFDLAWQGRAESIGMIEAVRVAAQLVKQKDRLVWRRT